MNGGNSGGEYGAHARDMDRDFSRPQPRQPGEARPPPLPPGAPTPVADRLSSFTQVRGLVLGQYSEASWDVHKLVELCAHRLARKHWRLAGARTEKEARGWWVGSCRRRIGVAVARAFARHRINRIAFIGVSRAVVADRIARGIGVARLEVQYSDLDFAGFYAHQALAGSGGAGA